MKCSVSRRLVHDYLDDEISRRVRSDLEDHLGACPDCRRRYAEFDFVAAALSQQIRMPGAALKPLRDRVLAESGKTIGSTLGGWLESVRTFWRDLDSQILWSKVTSVPLSLLFFFLIFNQVEQIPSNAFSGSAFDVTRLSYPALSGNGPQTPLLVTLVPGHQGFDQVSQLIDTVSDVPYEDDMELVALINRVGRIEIDDILVYPKNRLTMDANLESLRNTHFEPHRGSLKLVYRFQKIDVFEDENQAGM